MVDHVAGFMVSVVPHHLAAHKTSQCPECTSPPRIRPLLERIKIMVSQKRTSRNLRIATALRLCTICVHLTWNLWLQSSPSCKLKKVSERMVRKMVRHATICKETVRTIQKTLKLDIGVRRVQQIISEAPFLGFIKSKASVSLTELQKEKRQEWARKHLRWRRYGKKIIFTEKKFNADGPDEFQYYWHHLKTEMRFFLGWLLVEGRSWFGDRNPTREWLFWQKWTVEWTRRAIIVS